MPAREGVGVDKRLAVADDLRGEHPNLVLPHVLPDVWGLVGRHVEPEDLRERHALHVDDREAGEAPALERHHLLERRPAVHGQVLNDPVEDGAVRL